VKPFDAKEANGDGRWLLETELTARGLDHFGVYDHRILKDLQLPSFSEPAKLAWLPYRPVDWSSVVPGKPPHGSRFHRIARNDFVLNRVALRTFEPALPSSGVAGQYRSLSNN
jgi:hypothetical protein